MPNPWLSVPAVARRLRRPFWAVINAIHRGELRATLIGGARFFIHADDLAAYHQRQRGAADAQERTA